MAGRPVDHIALPGERRVLLFFKREEDVARLDIHGGRLRIAAFHPKAQAPLSAFLENLIRAHPVSASRHVRETTSEGWTHTAGTRPLKADEQGYLVALAQLLREQPDVRFDGTTVRFQQARLL